MISSDLIDIGFIITMLTGRSCIRDFFSTYFSSITSYLYIFISFQSFKMTELLSQLDRESLSVESSVEQLLNVIIISKFYKDDMAHPIKQ